MYYLVFGLLYLLSLLPLRVLYLLSDFAYWLVYHVFGYRKEVVLNNLAIAFPKKTEAEKIKIAKQFYRNFTDNFIETIKFISADDEWFRKHFIADPALFEQLYEQGYKCQVHLGHNFNWELGNLGMPLLFPYQLLSVYMPIKNKAMDRLFINIRKKTGAKLLPATDMRNAMIPFRNEKYVLALVADQNPGHPTAAYWINFFGRPTPFLKGPEKGARNAHAAVIFCHFTKKKRGYYQAHFTLATTEPQNMPETTLTRQYVAYLENVLRANPEMWLWSHRRWKMEWKPEYGPVLNSAK
jgi:KDO2-lipid IV(A) lauroyltransferase